MPGSTEIPTMAEEPREEDVEYESDPEEVKLSLKMRRREASDDEDEDDDGEGEENAAVKDAAAMPRRRIVDSDAESDGQGAAADYGDEDDEEEEEEEYEDEVEYVDDGYVDRKVEIVRDVAVEEEQQVAVAAKELYGDGAEPVDESEHLDEEEGGEEGEKKENEPFAVPTAGAFYMHDDRFRETGGRNRRTFGGRKLWESKDEKKWGHDKFEELTHQERHFDEGRASRGGRGRGRGRGRGPAPERGGVVRGNKPRPFNSNNNQNKNNPSNVPKTVRGRGPRKYQPSFRNSDDVPLTQYQPSGRTVEKPSQAGSGRVSTSSYNNSEAAPTRKQVFASSLNSASPPFYPSAAASKEIPQKRDASGTANRRAAVDPSFSTAPSSAMPRGKVSVDSVGMSKLYIDDSVSSAPGKPSTNLQYHSGSSSMSSTHRAQGRGMPQMTYQPIGSANQANRISPQTQPHATKRNPVQGRGQPSQQGSAQQFAMNSASGSQVSSPPKAAINKSSFEPRETTSEMNKSKAALVVNGKGSGRGSFLYGGAHGDPNFPAFLPLMQFGGQHPGGMGVPAVGMAFPGYVANPQLGGNSEMTWLPVLAGTAGGMGATYPFMSMDGSYNIRSPGQASSAVPAAIKDNIADKPSNEWNSVQRPGSANDDFGQRQKVSRRYTDMKFGQ